MPSGLGAKFARKPESKRAVSEADRKMPRVGKQRAKRAPETVGFWGRGQGILLPGLLTSAIARQQKLLTIPFGYQLKEESLVTTRQ